MRYTSICRKPLSENCLLKITNGNFTSEYKNLKFNKTIFGSAIRDFEVTKPGSPGKSSLWAIFGPAKSDFLQVAAGRFLSVPPLARSYPQLQNDCSHNKILFLNFRESAGIDKVHLSARYESFSYKGEAEISDDVNSVYNYITGANNYNSNSAQKDHQYVSNLLELLNLGHLSKKWINSLSNGQLRRAKLAKALINKPQLLILDDPFLGLDSDSTKLVSRSLRDISKDLSISVMLGLRIQDDVPEWIEKVAFVTHENGIEICGAPESVLLNIKEKLPAETDKVGKNKNKMTSTEKIHNDELVNPGEVPHIEFKNASVIYRGLPILRNLNWRIPKGTHWRIFGANGTGKTTILSLITADHPQSWKSVLSVDGVLRKTGSGSNFFDINNKIGISSPELHSLVPLNKTFMQVILNGLVKNIGNSNFMFDGSNIPLDDFAKHVLSTFDDEVKANANTHFGQLPITFQKLALFLRAVIKKPDLLILDEAFSCIDDPLLLEKCHSFVENDLRDVTVLQIAHIDWELPKCDYVIYLTGDDQRSYSLHRYVEGQ